MQKAIIWLRWKNIGKMESLAFNIYGHKMVGRNTRTGLIGST
jgi:hypothetical protein